MADVVSVQGSVVVAAPVVGAPALHRYKEAFARALPASQALSVEELALINIDLPSAIGTTLGKLTGILALRDKAKALPDFDVTAFEQLETYMLATGHAHSLFLGVSTAPEAIFELNEKGLKLRNTLYTDAVALAGRGLIGGDRIAELKANVGYKNLAFDLMALAGILRAGWDKISTKTAITEDDLDQAEFIGDQLMSAVGNREEAPANVAEVALQRQRNFTLFLKAYDQVRRAVGYLRWNEADLDRLAPSLYSGRGNSNARKKDDTQPTAPGATTTPALPTAGQPAVPAHAASTPAVSAAVPSPSSSSGLPGGNPFAGAVS